MTFILYCLSVQQVFFVFEKITELKAEHWEKEKELRQKIVQMQKEQAERMENLQVTCIMQCKALGVYTCREGATM